jgi:hypothetical protein
LALSLVFVIVRAERLWRCGGLLLLCAQLAGCPTRKEAATGSSGIVLDGGAGDRAGRTVVENPPDAPFQRDADLPPIGANEVTRDAGRQFTGDAKFSRDGLLSTVDMAPAACGIVTQTCGTGKGCYPTPDTGGVKCMAAGALGQGSACIDHNQCAPSLLCVEAGDAGAVCVRACDKATSKGCFSGDTCHGYDGNVGYCAP